MNTDELCGKIIEDPVGFRPPRDALVAFLKEASDRMMKVPVLSEVSGRGLFVGDTHGDLAHARSAIGLAKKRHARAIFLGDYVDRGSRQLETVNLVLAHWLSQPEGFILLRGNHEFKRINMKWGFADAVMEKYDETVYWLYDCVFAGMPHAVLLNGTVFGVHGGISPEIADIGDLRNFPRPGPEIYDLSMGHFWNDPSEECRDITENEGSPMLKRGASLQEVENNKLEPLLTENKADTSSNSTPTTWQSLGHHKSEDCGIRALLSINNSRRVFYTFGPDVFDDFMERNGLELFIRAHQKQPDGVKFFFDNRLISVFSSADHYKGVKPKAVLIEENGSCEVLAL